MSTNSKSGNKSKTKRGLSAAEWLLLILTVSFLLPAVLIGGWYGFMRLTTRQESRILPRDLRIASGDSQCTLVIPGGTLTIRRPLRTIVGTRYQLSADVALDEPLRFTDCEGKLPNWNINLEAQTTLVSAIVEPHAFIRQPAFDRDRIRFHWTFVPEEPVSTYRSHLWLRVIVLEAEKVVENWDLLVRDFPMSNTFLFGQPLVLWLIIAGASSLIGILFLILFIQKRHSNNRNAGV